MKKYPEFCFKETVVYLQKIIVLSAELFTAVYFR